MSTELIQGGDEEAEPSDVSNSVRYGSRDPVVKDDQISQGHVAPKAGGKLSQQSVAVDMQPLQTLHGHYGSRKTTTQLIRGQPERLHVAGVALDR